LLEVVVGKGERLLIDDEIELGTGPDGRRSYDPAMEYLLQFSSEQRGDMVLNPLDARCPFGSPDDEVPHEAEALNDVWRCPFAIASRISIPRTPLLQVALSFTGTPYIAHLTKALQSWFFSLGT
jgi:hypothetical protein